MDLWTVRVTTCASCSFVLTRSEKTPTDGLFCTLTTGQENSGLRHLDLTSPHNSRVDGLYHGGRGAQAGQVLPADVTEEHLKLYTKEVAKTVFDMINQEMEQKWKQKPRTNDMEENSVSMDCIVEGEVLKLGRSFLEFYHQNRDGQVMAKGVD
ncbi:hypothetical protein NP493_805g02055 [Ridgeia piscesae]|uniref:Uncharacterized protein n=1 Tax=Ridgeia piscesae TaxID=27915 RepID=A0AAD9KMM0_RIDPI|nr:hypothetical protein NP493_805g02055 [Ridgeia piscesae]